MKKVWLFLLTATLVLVLSGCGSSKQSVPEVTAAASVSVGNEIVPDESEAAVEWEDTSEEEPTVEVCDTPTMEDETAESVEVLGTFTGLMGYNGFIECHRYAFGDWCMWYYYGADSGEAKLLGVGFGDVEHTGTIVDLDGDGVTELVCNVIFGGDGAERCYVYKLGEDGAVVRYLMEATHFVAEEDLWGVGAVAQRYDEAEGFTLSYWGMGEEAEEQVFRPLWPEDFAADETPSENW